MIGFFFNLKNTIFVFLVHEIILRKLSSISLFFIIARTYYFTGFSIPLEKKSKSVKYVKQLIFEKSFFYQT